MVYYAQQHRKPPPSGAKEERMKEEKWWNWAGSGNDYYSRQNRVDSGYIVLGCVLAGIVWAASLVVAYAAGLVS